MKSKGSITKEITRIQQAPVAERARAIIESPDADRILGGLSPQESFLIIKDSWETDGQILLQFVPSEKIPSYLDLDCWENDNFSSDDLIEWLWALMNASEDSLMGALDVIDIELIVLVYQERIEVVQVTPTDEGIPDILDAGYTSIDNTFFFRFKPDVDDDYTQFLLDLLNILFSRIQDLYYTVMSSVSYELPSGLTETAYNRRGARLMEQGFFTREESVSIYRKTRSENLIDRGIDESKKPVIGSGEYSLPGIYRDALSGGSDLVASALADTDSSTRERFSFEMVYLTNKIVMADFRPLNNSEELARAVSKARTLCSLGLEIASRAKGVSAGEILAYTSAENLFSLAYNALLDRQKTLKSISTPIDFFPDADRSLVEGLLKRRPELRKGDPMDIESLDRVDESLDVLAAMSVMTGELGFEDDPGRLASTNAGSLRGLDLENVLLTTLAVNLLEKKSEFRPVSGTEMGSFLERISHVEGGRRRCREGVSNDIARLLCGLGDGVEMAVARVVAGRLVVRIDSEIRDVDDLEGADWRFISCVVVDLGE